LEGPNARALGSMRSADQPLSSWERVSTHRIQLTSVRIAKLGTKARTHLAKLAQVHPGANRVGVSLILAIATFPSHRSCRFIWRILSIKASPFTFLTRHAEPSTNGPLITRKMLASTRKPRKIVPNIQIRASGAK